MRMKLNALDLRLILALRLFHLLHRIDEEHELVLERVKANRALDAHEHSFFYRSQSLIVRFLLLLLEEFFAADAIRRVRQIKEQELRIRLELPCADAPDRTCQDDALHFTVGVVNGNRFSRKLLAKDQVCAMSHRPRHRR